MIKDGRKEEDIYESLEDDERGILLDDNKCILKSVWKKDVSSYLQRIRRCGLLTTKN